MWLTIFLVLTLLLFLPYAGIILLYRKWFLQLKPFKIPASFQPQMKFSIIIPARNEEKNISDCLQSIFTQSYPAELFEVIVVDDHSTDRTNEIVQHLQQQHGSLKLITLSDNGKALNSYKKKAIETAIGHASGEWILTTDADCLVTGQWLELYAAFIQCHDPFFVAAPVALTNDGSIVSVFQTLDFMALQGITAASVSAGFHSMCNGANLAYQKNIFIAVNGFRGIDMIASGDDMLLMNKIKKQYPDKVMALFAADACVLTHPMPDWKSFLNQRIRWASKADKLKDKNILWVLVMVYFLNVALFAMPFLALLNSSLLLYWVLFLTLKTIIEACFALPVARFFKVKLLWWFPLLQLAHITYTVMAGWLGMFGKYQWKGRQVK